MRLTRTSSGVLRWAIPVCALLALAGGGTGPARAQAPAIRHVLFLNAYHHGYEWSDDLVRGVREVLEQQPYPVEFWVEHMDTRRVSGPAYEAHIESLLRFKYGRQRLDLIAAADDAALAFLIDRRDSLFPGVPVVFMGINSEALIARADPRGYTGLHETLRTGDLVDLATTLRPSTRRIVVVSDGTETAAAQVEAYRAFAGRRSDLAFVFLDGGRMTLEQILERLGETSESDAVITTAFTRDFSGRYYPRDEALARIAAAARAPVYSAAVSRLGQGLLAGSENSGIHHAARAARMMLAVLAGTPPADIARQDDDEVPRFVIDYEQAVRWNVPESSLPSSAIFVNRPSSFYQANRTVIWGALGFIALQAAVIGALVVNIVRRRRAEVALAAQAGRLAASNADLERLNLSLRSEMNERRNAEDQLRQAQKFDAIGRLAGGVAHDFNNLLTVIGSYADLLVETLDPGTEARPHAEQIQRAAGRAAGLTQQLLAFSRKQVLQPRVVDLNAIVRGLEPMLHRLLGEDIALAVRLSAAPAAVLVDAGQIEQVIVNLAANARDAMPEGGMLMIESRHVELGAEEILGRPGMTAGRYVELAVTDGGVGMDEATRARIFEPFFTTKEPGAGTGLGLSTVYGIVKQSGGWIWVYSELTQGTTFRIHLPAADAAPEPAAAPPATSATRPPATETVLLVEDQEDVRALAARVLRREGYTVLEAASGAEAAAMAAGHPAPIHLLLTDVVMPDLSGKDVADRLLALRPGIRVLFMSGYTDNVIAQRGVLDPTTAFLSKPFTPDVLAAKVREVLEL
jgi:signal transduction histidine kinase/CheY-like chemotaxis protein